jgi:formylglycine-generating enzyme required for sulfatase activity
MMRASICTFLCAAAFSMLSCASKGVPPQASLLPPIALIDANVPTPIDASVEDDANAIDASSTDSSSADSAPHAEAPADMILVPAGAFTMGADKGGEEDEHPAHEVTLAGFYLDRTEVTNEAYAECVAAKSCRQKDLVIASRTHAGPDATFHRPKQPVDGVSWDDARTYCQWRGKRLPHEAEFEKAERDSDGRKFAWGDAAPTFDRACYGKQYGFGTTDDVGSHPSGRGPYGHDDLVGNVWEWVEDEYDPYAYKRATANIGKPGSCAEILAAQNELRAQHRQGYTGSNAIPVICEHVLRGGAFNYDGPGLRASNRVHHPGIFRLVMSGFRCAKDE